MRFCCRSTLIDFEDIQEKLENDKQDLCKVLHSICYYFALSKKSTDTIAHVALQLLNFFDTKALSDRMAERDFLAYITSSRLVLDVVIAIWFVCYDVCAHSEYFLLTYIINIVHPPPYHQRYGLSPTQFSLWKKHINIRYLPVHNREEKWNDITTIDGIEQVKPVWV